MLKHIVFIKLQNKYSKSEKDFIIGTLSSLLNDLPKYISEIEHLETGINFSPRASAFDLSLYVELQDEASLEQYRVHPKHKKVLEYMSSLKLETAVVDYIK